MTLRGLRGHAMVACCLAAESDAAGVALLEMDAIAEHDRAVERQPRLRTVPGDGTR
jgi:hypothetical protein